jgi:membrane protease YdiL (CAAX protease family)
LATRGLLVQSPPFGGTAVAGQGLVTLLGKKADMNSHTQSDISSTVSNPVAAGQPAFPTFWISVGWIAMYSGLQILFGILAIAVAMVTNPDLLASLMSGATPSEADFLGMLGVPLFVSVLLSGIAALAILWWHLKRDNRHEKIGLFAPSRLPLLKTILLSIILMIGVALFGEAYSRYIVPGQELQAGINQLIAGISKTPLNHLLLFITIAVIAPVLEEVLFRGYLQTSLMHHMKPWMAILLASSIFAILHLQLLAFPVLTALGAVFGYLYYKTGSLKVNIILHVINNGIAYILMAMGISAGA